MNWITILAVGLVLADSAAWGATLTWNPNTDIDLAGYRVYQCTRLPCNRTSGTAIATLGTVTSFNIGTPSAVRHYVVTAYDSSNNESGESGVVTYTPAAAPPPTTPPPAPPPTPTGLQLLTVR
ncbi:MAG: hypothetical protein RL768_1647 [Nitrospirota bacterium]|jgi:hypothetical protein